MKHFIPALMLGISMMSFPLSGYAQEAAQSPELPVIAPSPDIVITGTPVTDAPAGQAPESIQTIVTLDDPLPEGAVPINPNIASDVTMAPDGTAVPAAMDMQPVLGTPVEREINEQIMFHSPLINPNAMKSLFFNKYEHDLIVTSRIKMNSRPPGNPDEKPAIVIESPRDVILGGIVYLSSKEWTIWLNETRVTPTALPNEVMSIKVFKDYIQIEWFDAQTNQIFPIRLRTHQRFNLDTRMFLPG